MNFPFRIKEYDPPHPGAVYEGIIARILPLVKPYFPLSAKPKNPRKTLLFPLIPPKARPNRLFFEKNRRICPKNSLE
jgi:hypothetical protein